MNRLISGRPGGGKSYHACKLILEALEESRVVVTNVPMHTDKIAREPKRFAGRLVVLDDDDMRDGEFFFSYPGAFIVVDEAKDFLPAGIQQKDLTKGWTECLTKHRHYEDWKGRSSEVVLISQCASQLPKCVRTMMEQTIVCKKLRAVGLNQYYSAVTYEGPQAIDDARESAKLHSEKGKYTRAVYQFYQSHSQAGGNAGHIEAGGGANVLLGSVGRYVGIMLVVGGVGLYFLVSNPLVSSALGGSDEQGEREDESRQAGGAAAAATAPAPPARELRPRAPAAGEASMSSWLPDEAITASWHTGARCGVVTVSGTRKQGRGADCQALEFVELADGSAAVEGDQGSAFDGFGLAVR